MSLNTQLRTLPLAPSILILGPGDHGKSTCAELLCEKYGWKFRDSSRFVLERAVWPALGGDYADIDECYADRKNRRATWQELIAEYCNPKDRLAREILAESNIYVGQRDAAEYAASRDLFDVILWVLDPRKPVNDPMSITPDERTQFVINAGDKALLLYEAEKALRERGWL